MIERISNDGKELALIIRSSFHEEGVSFLTPPDNSIQLGYMEHPAGHRIAPHIHQSIVREVTETQEVLFIRSGRLQVDFYGDSKNYIESRELQQGDIILLVGGGHGFTVLENVEMFEVKQGPYVGDLDKERFLRSDTRTVEPD